MSGRIDVLGLYQDASGSDALPQPWIPGLDIYQDIFGYDGLRQDGTIAWIDPMDHRQDISGYTAVPQNEAMDLIDTVDHLQDIVTGMPSSSEMAGPTTGATLDHVASSSSQARDPSCVRTRTHPFGHCLGPEAHLHGRMSPPPPQNTVDAFATPNLLS